jgi:hypothetical protein
MTRFRLNARAFGGLGLLLIGVILIAPLWAGLLETGIIGELPSNIIQIQEGVRHQFPSSQATIPLLTIMVISFLAFVFLYREKRRRARS